MADGLVSPWGYSQQCCSEWALRVSWCMCVCISAAFHIFGAIVNEAYFKMFTFKSLFSVMPHINLCPATLQNSHIIYNILYKDLFYFSKYIILYENDECFSLADFFFHIPYFFPFWPDFPKKVEWNC